MAKYTELLSEYLENHELPTIFEEIDGFSDLFKGHFIDREIGFETEVLFEIKLETKAQIVIPIYADKISKLAVAKERFFNPNRTTVQGEVNSYTNGEQKGSVTNLPFNSPNAEPNTTTKTEQYINSESKNLTRTDYVNTQDAKTILDALNNESQFLLQKCLDEFKPLFMSIY